MDDSPVAACDDGGLVAPVVETPEQRAARLSRMLYRALVERGMDDASAELAAETLLERLEES